MDKAYSFLKHKLIPASSAEYRQNLDEQIVCPTCYEQVFKKKLWVISRQSHTHFFSHYYGDPESCSERTSGEGDYENSSDKFSQLQKLEIFNQNFRKNILTSFVTIVGKKTFNKLSSAIEFAERLCINEIDNVILEKLEIKLMDGLDQPITTSISEKLDSLEDALLPIYYHLKNQHGQKNLKFITCIVLLLIFYKEYEHLEDILKKNVINSSSDIDKKLLGNVVLLLINSVYVNWSGSVRVINDFLDSPIEKKQPKKKTPQKNPEGRKYVREKKTTSGYFACVHCKDIQYSEPNKYKHCISCDKWFFTSPEEKLKGYKKLSLLKARSELNLLKPTNKNIDARWIYCISCNHHYFAEKVSLCPHRVKPEIPAIKPSIVSEQPMNCSKCKAKYIETGNGCPFCSRNTQTPLTKCRSCGKGLIKTALLPSKAGSAWRKCNFCNLNFEYKNF